MSTIFLNSEYGKGLPLLFKLKSEGHKFIFDLNHYLNQYDGMGEQNDLMLVDNPNVVLFDEVGMGAKADKLRETYNVVGGNIFQDKVAFDNIYMYDILRISDIPITHGFDDGVPIGIQGWFNGEKFIENSFVYVLNLKRFMTGDLGKEVESAGSLMFPCRKQEGPLARKLLRLTSVLKAVKFKGQICLDCLVDTVKRKSYVESINTNLRYIDNFVELFKGDLGNFLILIGKGETPEFELRNGFSLSVKVSIPPFPLLHPGVRLNYQISYPESIKKNCYWLDVFNKGGDLYSAGNTGSIGSVCVLGETLRAAGNSVITKLQSLEVKDKQYRIDVADSFGLMLEKLKWHIK